ncbi:EamA family transporter [Psychrosphaera sp. B3R10]|uniref:DMT family transporter n=1 Tax=unclassified Psychrosphaera TaxID=2641570 RepID=UPI001C087C53|nr:MULTISPECIES: EamA family transporter [unclassified Psychrosphaera]MBU2881261.1 EamA family transporter [Psychrosphaera sp. I2R16]MBU2988360.1 EamA family transporter [Psychrosphaera sp. B3R10]MDO6720140.1 EamA family transporter [Psychrosphaera sp. 1_MG-2023]
MPVSAAFVLVIIIWSTTPLGIVWSSESIPPTLSLFMRMAIAVVLGLPLMKLLGIKLDWRPKAIRVYLYSSLSLAIGMLFCYLAARHISSGLMSLSFGIAPILSGLFAQQILNEARFTPIKMIALTIALGGLTLVCMDNLSVGESSLIGFACISVGVIMFSLSGVLVKSVDIDLHPLSTTMGSLILSMPMFVLFWYVMDGQINYEQWQPKAIAAVIYLGIFASLIGFLAYFYVLKNLLASSVALIVMVTPVVSTGLGVWLNDERFSMGLVIGGLFVIVGLGLFQFGDKWFRRNKSFAPLPISKNL